MQAKEQPEKIADDDGAELARLEGLETLKVEAELLEIEIATTKSSLSDILANLNVLPDIGPGDQDPERQKAIVLQRDRMASEYDRLQSSYTKKRISLIRLKRQIDVESRKLGISPAIQAASRGDTNARLGVVEAKLDRILGLLEKNAK